METGDHRLPQLQKEQTGFQSVLNKVKKSA